MLLHGGFCHSNAEFLEFPDNTRGTPRGIGLPHVLDQGTDLFGNGRSARCAVLTETSLMISETFLLPGNDRARLDDCHSPLPAGPQPRAPHPEHAIRRLKRRSGDTLFVDCNLVVQGSEFHLHGKA